MSGFAGAEADRRIAALLSIGTVTDVYPDGTARVAIGELGTPKLPVGALRAGGMQVWWMPSLDEQVLVAAPSGDLARGVILCSIHAGNEPSSDITRPTIDLRGGEMVIRGGKLRIEADLEIDGRIDCTGDVVAGAISLQTHRHGGVSPGPVKTDLPE